MLLLLCRLFPALKFQSCDKTTAEHNDIRTVTLTLTQAKWNLAIVNLQLYSLFLTVTCQNILKTLLTGFLITSSYKS